ncbi:hypothetical protein FQZ97_1204470 [compost metagenome]
MQQVFGQQREQRLGLIANGDAGQARAMLGAPGIEQTGHGQAKGVKLGVAEDGWFDLTDRNLEAEVTGAQWLEQGAAQIGHHLPVAV